MYKVYWHNSHSFLPVREDGTIPMLDISSFDFATIMFLALVLTRYQGNSLFLFLSGNSLWKSHCKLDKNYVRVSTFNKF